MAAVCFVAGYVYSSVSGPSADPTAYLQTMASITTTVSSAPVIKTLSSGQSKPTGDVQADVTKCLPITKAQTDALQHEIKDYEDSKRFNEKVEEVKGMVGVALHHTAIDKYLREKVLQPGWSVLELGCAAGMMLQMVDRAYEAGIGTHGELVGVELVTGWVKFAQSYHKKIKIFEGDITNFVLPEPYTTKTFDFVMLNDVAEHIQNERYGCFFQKLQQVTHHNSIVYMHTPTPQAQLADKDQYLENVLPHHYLVMGMALAGFELMTFEHDLDTDCSVLVRLGIVDYEDATLHPEKLPKMVRGVKCMYNGFPKYYHAVFRRASSEVLTLA
jgi:SAM-dependent methyltransferase